MRYLSLFDGIGAACVAWEPLGWQPAAFAEIDTPSAELVRRVRANLIRWAKGRQRMAA